MAKDNYTIMLLFLFTNLIQLSLSIKANSSQSITFIERVGEPQCLNGRFRFNFKLNQQDLDQTI